MDECRPKKKKKTIRLLEGIGIVLNKEAKPPKVHGTKSPKMHKRTRINSVCQQTFSKSLMEREEHPKEDLDATHAIIKGKGK